MERASQVRQAVSTWRGQLIDLSWRNQLLYYKDLRHGTLDFADADLVAVEQLLSGQPVVLSQLYRRTLFADRRNRVRAIRNKAREAAEERGIAICHVALGMATWRNAQGAAVPAAPVLLRAAAIDATTAAEDDFELRIVGDPVPNPALLHLLTEQFKIDIEVPDESDFGAALAAKAAVVPGFTIKDRTVLGTFTYAKLPMVEDLDKSLDALVAHDVVAAIAGHRPAAHAIAAAGAEVGHTDPDSQPPHEEFLVLDADSSQSYAINAVVAGQSLVLSGPPGTGKSQTIANMIATLVARGQSVLFVAEKRAAISAVLDRLTRVGLADVAFDVHDGGGSRTAVVERLTGGLTAPTAPAPDNRLALRRGELGAHAEATNRRRDPWGISVFEARSALLGLAARYGRSGATDVRLGAEVRALDAATMSRVREDLYEYVGLTGGAGPWAGASVGSAEEAESALQTVAELSSSTLPELWRALDAAAADTGLIGPQTLWQWADRLDLYAAVAASPVDLAAGLDELETAARPFSISARKRLRDESWIGATKPNRRRVQDALASGAQVRATWAAAALDGGAPRVPSGFAEVRAKFERALGELATLQTFLPWTDFAAMPRAQLSTAIARLLADAATLRKLPRSNELADRLRRLGLDPLLTELRARRTDPELATVIFETCWYRSVLDRIGFDDAVVGNFDGIVHDKHAAEFRALDAAHVRGAAARVLQAAATRLHQVTAANPEQQRIVAAQAARARGHLPLRQLFAAAPDLLTALKPCWAMSPLVVSQILPGDRPYFDVVIFDEASQIVPADAIPAIARARRVVVAGDRNQLPPTQFFAVDAEDTGQTPINDDGSVNLALTTGFESILDVLTAALRAGRTRSLSWHYRSRDERLIAFSNAWVYDNGLTTFPGVSGPQCLSHVHVRARAGADSVDAEVDRVVAMVLEHATQRPHESLGVITMGITHMERIDVRLRERLRTRSKGRAFFDDGGAEPFFVKNLERVQGDERDAVILSIGYGKRPDGTLSHNFGPLNQEGGHRRLNVAITRARIRMTVVSGFDHRDMDPEKSTAPGVAMLRGYLHFAAAHGAPGPAGTAAAREEPSGAVSNSAPTAFETSVTERLRAAGMSVTARYGVTGHWIDFAVARPDDPSRMLLAVESDGPTYRDAHTARDRDRLRPEQLGRLGWGFYRLWSADWFADPDGCVARIQAAYVAAQGPVAPGRAITDYSEGELVAVLQSITADGRPRSVDELFADFMSALGFARRGQRLRTRFDRAVAHARIPTS